MRLGSWVTGLSLLRLADFGLFSGVSAAGLLAVFLLILVGALGEETGWRGFALPHLQQRFSPLVASLILAALWALWHLPLFFVLANYRAFGVVKYVGSSSACPAAQSCSPGCTTTAAAASCSWRSGTESLT